MADKTISKNISSLTKFDARKLHVLANRIQVFYLDEKGFVIDTCRSIWNINEEKKTNFYQIFKAFEAHREAIEFLSTTPADAENQSLAIPSLEIIFEEETFFVDVLFQKPQNNKDSFALECLIENKTEYYTSLNQLKEHNKLQEIEFLNEKWQLTKEADILEVNHQKELTALNEQLRLDWTNLLADNLKRIITENFIQSSQDKSFENLVTLSDSFEKISGICLIPKEIKPFLSLENSFLYIGKNDLHKKLIQTTVELAGGKFIEKKVQNLEFDFSEIDFIFIEQDIIQKEIKNTTSFCLLASPSFLEKEQKQINNEVNVLIYPLYPFQIWQQLLSFINTNTMSYNEKIDLSQIYEIVDNEPMLVQNMLQILDKNLREYPAQLQKEFNEGKLDTLRQTVHKFKSCTAYTGLTQFNTTLSEIEASQENGWTIAQIKDKLEYVLQAIPVIKVQVDAKLKKLEEELS